jgi:hypothetical protein
VRLISCLNVTPTWSLLTGPLRTGTYSKTVTFTLSTTNP